MKYQKVSAVFWNNMEKRSGIAGGHRELVRGIADVTSGRINRSEGTHGCDPEEIRL